MPIDYASCLIEGNAIPAAVIAAYQVAIDTYASETNKVASVWRGFSDADLNWRPHPCSSAVGEILKHQLLSERRFFGEFLGCPEPPPDAVLPPAFTVAEAIQRLGQLARRRLPFLAAQEETWWLERVRFFDVDRERAWIFWRRILHTAHHRTQLAVYLRLLDRPVPSIYGPTADEKWEGADPTQSVSAGTQVK
jgi:uncharacterized damage-inducible protein DinB